VARFGECVEQTPRCHYVDTMRPALISFRYSDPEK
jgi:hypothetical protein